MRRVNTIDDLHPPQTVFFRRAVEPRHLVRATAAALDPEQPDKVYVVRPNGSGTWMRLATLRLPDDDQEAARAEIPFVPEPPGPTTVGHAERTARVRDQIIDRAQELGLTYVEIARRTSLSGARNRPQISATNISAYTHYDPARRRLPLPDTCDGLDIALHLPPGTFRKIAGYEPEPALVSATDDDNLANGGAADNGDTPGRASVEQPDTLQVDVELRRDLTRIEAALRGIPADASRQLAAELALAVIERLAALEFLASRTIQLLGSPHQA